MAVSALGLKALSTSTFTKAGAGGVEGALDGGWGVFGVPSFAPYWPSDRRCSFSS